MCRITCLFSVKRVKSVMPSANATEKLILWNLFCWLMKKTMTFTFRLDGHQQSWHPPEGKDGHLMSPYVTEENVGVSRTASLCWSEDGCAMEGNDWGSIRLVWGYLHWPFESLETAVPGNLHGSFWESECRGARHLTCIVFPSYCLPLESSTSEVFLVCALWIFSTAVLNTSAYKMWESSEKRIN